HRGAGALPGVGVGGGVAAGGAAPGSVLGRVGGGERAARVVVAEERVPGAGRGRGDGVAHRRPGDLLPARVQRGDGQGVAARRQGDGGVEAAAVLDEVLVAV